MNRRLAVTDHVFRTVSYTGTRHPRFAKCAFRGTCEVAEVEHISADDFRSLKARSRASRERS